MGSAEFHELHEHADHAKQNSDLAPVSVTMAILAVLVAGVSLLGHRTHTEEVVLQGKVTDQWAFFQAKNIRRHIDQMYVDMNSAVTAKDEQAVKIKEKYAAEAKRYEEEQKELQTEARKLEAERDHERDRAKYYDLGEVFIEIALVVTSITILSGKRMFWQAGIAVGAVGIVIAVVGFLIPAAA